MKNIILNCFPTAFSLESFLVAINLKLESKSDEDQLKDVLKKLSSIIIAFDFDLKGQYRSYIDRRFTYEQLLYLCYIKINESKVASFENHMFKMSNSSMNNSNSGALAPSTSALNLTNQGELERKLNSSDNLSILYFMSKNGDGAQWRLLHSLIGSSIMKYLFLYAFMFKQLESAPSTYVQICGTKFTFVYRSLISQKLQVDEKAIEAKSVLKKKSRSNESQSLKQKEEIPTISQTKLTLNEVFQEREKKIYSNVNSAKSVESQLDKFGHRFLNKRVILYDRNLSTKIPKKYIYSNKDLPANSQTASRIIDWVIFKEIDLQMFPNKLKLDEAKEQLRDIILKFQTLHRTCPYGIFLHCYCKNPKNTQVKSKDSLENSILPTKGVKRKRDDGNTIKENESTLRSYIQPKFVYCFIRRCLMHVLEYTDKPGKIDSSCPLIGGKDNFKILLKHLKLVLFGLKFDSITMNSLLHGLKQARISYLKSIECHKYKRLVLLAVIRWLFEDYILMVVRANFFVTDTSNTNSEIFFYTKSDWRRIVEEGLSKSAYKSIYNLEKIRESDLIFYCSQYQSHGMHLGRLLPKNVNNECRVISGCKVYNPCTNKIWSSNFKFITLNSCLRWLIKTDPSLTGFACPGQKDLFRKYSKFLSQNCLNRTPNSIKHWNFLKFDLNKCFDSINTKELISYIDQLFRKHLGYDQAYSVVRYTKFRLDVDMKQVRCKYEYLTVKHHTHDKAFANGIADFAQAFENSSSLYRLSNTDSQIFVPLALHDRNINSRRLLDLLKMCVQHVVIKIHNDLYERMNGILQGSVCARNLCDLYLGRIESRLFYYSNSENISLNMSEKTNRMCLNPTNEIICRIVDDYLVISDNAEKIQRVKSMLKNELSINENKTSEWIWSAPKNTSDIEMKSNDDEDNEDFDLSDIVSISSAQCFAWCGFGFDVRTLDIYFNYDKYLNSSSSLNNRFNATNDYRSAFLTFNAKFLRLFCMNLSPLVIDTRVNSVPAILRNIVDLFAISSVRFMIMWRQMPQQVKSNLRLQLKLILNLCHLVNNSVCDKVKQVLDKYFYSTFSLFKFLCLTAYCIILKRFGQSTKTHCHLLKLINVHLQKLDFLRCIRIRADTIYAQLLRLVDEQSVKFFKCKI